MGQRYLMYPWRNMICDDCEARGLPSRFLARMWGDGHDHHCPSLTREEIRKIFAEELAKVLAPNACKEP